MRFKDYVLESIIDIPRTTYAPAVFDDADTKNPKIKSSVLKLINDQIKDFKKDYPVIKIALIGSILTKRYRNDADLDINVLFDVPKEKQEDERVSLSQKYLSAKNPDNIQGKEIPGTKHPINFYFITDQETYDDQNKKADAVFDIEKNKFIKRPDDFIFDTDLYVKEFERKVQELDVVKGELKRDIIDYDELQELKPNDILNLQDKINDKLEEIEDGIKDIIKVGDTVDTERRSAFDTDMSPDEIRTYGVKNRLPKNVIYKMLEKYHYLKFYKKCKQILDDGKVTDAEVDSLKTESIASTFSDLIRRTFKAPRMRAGVELYMKYLKQGIKDAKNKAAQHAGIDYNEFGKAVRDAGLPEEVKEEVLNEDKSIAFTFGRFNPPTSGHEKLIRKVKSISANDHKIYLSKSQDSKKNPLSPDVKFRFMRDIFKAHKQNLEISPTNMVLDLLAKLHKKNYSDITMVVGSDRVREFENILNKYNDVKSRHGYYNFDKINVVSAGERDPDAEGTAGISASKMRDAAAKGDYESFKKGLPASYRNPADIERLMSSVRSGMGIKTKLAASYGGLSHVSGSKPVASMNEFEQKQIRDLYVREVIFNIGDKIDYIKENLQGTVKRRGTNYIVLEDNNNNLHKAWIWDCVPVSSDKEVALREFNLNIDYGFKAVSEVKEPEIKKKLTDSLKKKAFGALRKELNMKQDENESYEIGADYANHTKEVTPGQKPDAKPIDAKQKGSETVITKEDIEKWQTTDETIDKYKKRYSEEWKSKLDEVVKRMMEKI
jgi:predicted nucleotidyltransferase